MARVILTHEITGLGEAGDVVDVKDGYARNYLVPRKLATPWTKGAERQIQAMRKARRVRALASTEDAQRAAERLAQMTVQVPAKAGATGRLFGTVTTADIVAAVAASGGPKLDKRKIEVGTHIKTLGQYTVSVRLHESVVARIDLDVVPA
ncbi:MAG: 50S ribosomal protein L9 [Bifidobacteriaceae bacterium]|jgi:large subunit ribosomal protein L9|nr:50S ribosomal protein L9 [Bifidobacteriaceae bacterium]